MQKTPWIFAILILGVVAFYALAADVVKPNKQPLPEGFAETEGSNVKVTDKVLAYDFEAVTIDGKKFNLVDYRGKWVFVDFFATW